jgi:hypothetical protein
LQPRYLERLRRIQDAGITVNGCFILGLDGHDTSIFEQVLDFALEVPLYDVQITLLTPFQAQPSPAVTVTAPFPPWAGMF